MKYVKSANRTTNSIRNVAVGLTSQILLTVAAFGCRMVFVRCLSEEYLGLNGLFINLLSMLCLAELGIGTAIIYELYGALAEHDEERIKTLMRFYRRLYNAVGIFVILSGLALMPFIPKLTGGTTLEENIYVIYIIYLLGTGGTYFFSYRSALITADQKNYIITAINSVVVITQDIVQIVLLITTRKYVLYILCQLVFTLINNTLYYSVSNRLYPFLKSKSVQTMDKELKQRMIVNSKATVVSKVSYALVNSTDHIIISALCGLANTGIVSNYTLISQTMQSFVKRIFESMTASIGNLNTTNNDTYREKVFYEINFMCFLVYSWSALVFLTVSGFLVRIFFGDVYIMAHSIVFVIAVNYYTDGMYSIINNYRNTLGIFKQGQYMNLVTGALNILFSILLGNIWGVFGILLATLIARSASVFWYFPYTVFHYGFGVSAMRYYKRYAFYFIVFAGIYGIMQFVHYTVAANDTIRFIIDSFMVIIIPFVIYIAVFHRTTEFQTLKGRIIKELKKRKKRS